MKIIVHVLNEFNSLKISNIPNIFYIQFCTGKLFFSIFQYYYYFNHFINLRIIWKFCGNHENIARI